VRFRTDHAIKSLRSSDTAGRGHAAVWFQEHLRVFERSIALAVCGVNAARAHHSTAEYDSNSVAEARGEVVSVLWRNPHVRVQVSTQAIDGNTELWEDGRPPRGGPALHPARLLGRCLGRRRARRHDDAHRLALLSTLRPRGRAAEPRNAHRRALYADRRRQHADLRRLGDGPRGTFTETVTYEHYVTFKWDPTLKFLPYDCIEEERKGRR
jgi:Family of unknown function (DUF6152)